MSDALRKDIPISQPTYCVDKDTGQIIDGSIMYDWMHVRAAGPNCLRNTKLCGTTEQVGGALIGVPPILSIVLGNTGTHIHGSIDNTGIADILWHFQGENDPTTWDLSLTSTNYASDYIDYIDCAVFPSQCGALGFSNISDSTLTVLVNFNFDIALAADPPGAVDSLVNIAVYNINGPATGTASLASPVSCLIPWKVGSTLADHQHHSLEAQMEIDPETGTGDGTVCVFIGTTSADAVNTLNANWFNCTMNVTVLSKSLVTTTYIAST